MRRDDHIDFFLIKDEHLQIDSRLQNWSRWVRVRPFGWQVSPMFKQAQSNSRQWHAPEPKQDVNVLDAVEVEKAVSLLPEKHREAIRWAYVWSSSPVGMAKRLGVSKAGLMELVHNGRTMLRNRMVTR